MHEKCKDYMYYKHYMKNYAMETWCYQIKSTTQTYRLLANYMVDYSAKLQTLYTHNRKLPKPADYDCIAVFHQHPHMSEFSSD